MIQFIVFSRKRPLQLYGYLESIFRNISEQIEVSVLLKVDESYGVAYAEIQERFPNVHFRHETDFTADIHALVDRSAGEYISFGCDDVIFTGSIIPDNVNNLFERIDILGLSLRLGRNVNFGMFGNPMPKPVFESSNNPRFLIWNVEHSSSVGDWAYPWEVLGTIYPRPFVEAMLNQMQPRNPSQLEDMGTRLWATTTKLRLMACYPTLRIVVPTVNCIQTEFSGNGFLGQTPLSPEYLLDSWHHGMRMETIAFAARDHDSWRIPHFYLRRA